MGLNDSVTHDFGDAGTNTIRIRGTYDSIRFNFAGDHFKIISIDQWGTQSWTTMFLAFNGAKNLTVPATDTPDFSAVTSMKRMFSAAASANPDTSGWDTAKITDMRWMFLRATSFDQDIGSWDVASLELAADMFFGHTLSTANYDSLLIGWDAQELQAGVSFSGGNSNYCSTLAIEARANMMAADSWVITDDGPCPPPADPGIAPDLTPATDTGVSDSDNFTSDTTPDFFVACSAIGNTITLYTDNPTANTAIGTHVCETTGTETASTTTALTVGVHNISYTDKLGSAESGHSPSLEVTISTIVFADSFETPQP